MPVNVIKKNPESLGRKAAGPSAYLGKNAMKKVC